MDWAQCLERMYQRWAADQGYQVGRAMVGVWWVMHTKKDERAKREQLQERGCGRLVYL